MRHLLLLVVASIQFATHATCEDQATNLTRVFVGMVESSLTTGTYSTKDIRAYVEGDQPLERHERSVENFEQQRTLSKLYHRMSDIERDRSRRDLRQVLGKKEQQAKAVEAARIETQYVVTMRESLELKPTVAGVSLWGKVIFVEREGRPMFFGQQCKGKERHYVQFDPFHKDPGERVKLLYVDKERLDPPAATNMLSIFEWNGKKYFAVFEEKFLWNLDDGRKEPFSILGHKDLESAHIEGLSHALIQTPWGLKFIAPRGVNGELAEYNLSHPEIPGQGLSLVAASKVRAHNLAGENFVTTESSSFVYGYFPDRRNSSPFIISKPARGTMTQFVLPFHDQDQNQILSISHTINSYTPDDFTIGILDITGKNRKLVEEKVQVKGRPVLIHRTNGPQVLLATNRGLATLDLRSQKFVSFHSEKVERRTAPQLFTWREKEYIVWSNTDNSVGVYDLESLSYARTKPASGYIIGVIPFEYEGLPYAFVANQLAPPKIVKIISSTLELK